MESPYRDAATDIEQVTGYSCKDLTEEEMDIVGKAFENGDLFWERGNEGDAFESVEECLIMYVGGAFLQIGKQG